MKWYNRTLMRATADRVVIIAHRVVERLAAFRFGHDGQAVTNPLGTSTKQRRVALLKSGNFTRFATAHPGRLPYRVELLERLGYRLSWTDDHLNRRWHGPWAQTWQMRSARRRADVTLVMFESEGHPAALLRSFAPARPRRGRLVIISCWLGELLRRASPTKLALYRRIYRGVDLVTVFSENQATILTELLGLPAHRVAVVSFGVDIDELDRLDVSEDGSVLAVGRDLGRDWPTLLAAVDGTGWTVRVATRNHQIDGQRIPSEVTLLGMVPREEYLRLLAAASVVVIATHDVAYPTGQSVLLEAMGLGKACVVTETPAMLDYAAPGVNCLTAQPGEHDDLRAQVQRLLDDSTLRHTIGATAKERVHRSFTAASMWGQIAATLDGLLDRDGQVKW
jgi:glycosyltransferase involved in cell wall biosynthesis